MREVIYQEKNSLGEEFRVRKENDTVHFSVLKGSNGENFLGQYDTTQNILRVWRTDSHIKEINGKYYFGVNAKIIAMTSKMRAIEFEGPEETYLVPLEILNKHNTYREPDPSFMQEVYIDLETILQNEAAPF